MTRRKSTTPKDKLIARGNTDIEYACVENDNIEQATITGQWTFDVRLNQLSEGKFYSRFEYVRTPDLMLYEQHWSQRVEVLGYSPKHCVMLGVNIAGPGKILEWCGKILSHQRFSCSAPGGAIDFKSPSQGRHMVMLANLEQLEKALGRKQVALLIEKNVIDFRPADAKRLVAAMKGIIRAFSNTADLDEEPMTSRSVKKIMFETLDQCLQHSEIIRQSDTYTLRELAVKSALSFVERHNGPVTAFELALATGVSQRTMEYAFRDQMGMTPARYLRIYRLNAAHRDLIDSDPALATVTQIAYKWGFNHPGRFSQAHRQLFGETPHDVLKR